MQVPILNGISVSEGPEFRTKYPRNMIPVPKQQGISNGFIRPADGIDWFSDGPGIDRGGINHKGHCYRVVGDHLVEYFEDGTHITIGEVPGINVVRMDYSFDYLAIASDGRFFLWKPGSTVKEVTDTDLGVVVDFCWVDGYFLTTDGTFLVVTELTDPFSVNPLKYGSSEVDPDPIKAVLSVHNEPHALNRYTIEVFDNIGGENFPFQRIKGAQIQRGTVGTRTAVVFNDAVAFMGSGRNEEIAVWFGRNASTIKISTREIDIIINKYSEAELAKALMETRVSKHHSLLYIHLPDETLVYDHNASVEMEQPVWFTLSSGLHGNKIYRARNFVWCFNKWICGDPLSSNLGTLTNKHSYHYNQPVSWEFQTIALYAEGMNAMFSNLELVALTGNVELGVDPTVWSSYSDDGLTWSQEKPLRVGKIGDSAKRVIWFNQGGLLRHWKIFKFRGTSHAQLSFARLEIEVEKLNA